MHFKIICVISKLWRNCTVDLVTFGKARCCPTCFLITCCCRIVSARLIKSMSRNVNYFKAINKKTCNFTYLDAVEPLIKKKKLFVHPPSFSVGCLATPFCAFTCTLQRGYSRLCLRSWFVKREWESWFPQLEQRNLTACFRCLLEINQSDRGGIVEGRCHYLHLLSSISNLT